LPSDSYRTVIVTFRVKNMNDASLKSWNSDAFIKAKKALALIQPYDRNVY
jgi:hypothetical protein